MTRQFEVYKCMHCGNIVEVVHGGGAPLVCCGENMKLMAEGTSDGAKEKHVPVLEKTAGKSASVLFLIPWKKPTISNGLSFLPTARATENFLNPAKSPKRNSALTPPM